MNNVLMRIALLIRTSEFKFITDHLLQSVQLGVNKMYIELTRKNEFSLRKKVCTNLRGLYLYHAAVYSRLTT